MCVSHSSSLIVLLTVCDSFVVDSKDNASAEKRGVFVGPGRIVVIGFVPEALAGDADALSEHLPDNALDHNFVTGDVELLRLVLDLHDDGLGPLLVLLVVEVHPVELAFDDLFNDAAHLRRVEPLVLSRLHPVRRHVRHSSSELHLLVFFL